MTPDQRQPLTYDGPLDENESKKLLAGYGIPMVEERLAITPAEAAAAAQAMGYPVVLKGVGRGITHKTERGLVRLHLGDDGALKQAAAEIQTRADGQLDGFLVQRQVPGNREWVAGMLRDPQFGPVIMFGLGGIFTEALSDVSFALAPLSADDARRML